MSKNPTNNIDYTNKDYEAFREMMINKLQEKMPEYTDTSETDAGIVILEALANGLDILSMYADIVANDMFLPTTQSRKIAVLLANTLGYYPYEQTASEYEQVFILTATQSTDTLIPKGTVIKIPNIEDDLSIYYETLEDFTIPANCLGDEKDGNDDYIYHTTIRSGKTVSEDVLGSSTGSPLQSFVLTHSNVLLDTLKVYVDSGNGEELWERVDSFLNSDGYDNVYTVSVDDIGICTVHFGNGLNGKIPVALSNNISATYMIGGGEKSNVSAGVITQLDTNIAFVGSTFNLAPNTLAHNRESLESIKINAPATFFIKDRLITLEDYSKLIKANFPEIRDIIAINEDALNPTDVMVYYRMKNGYSFNSSDVMDFIRTRQISGVNVTFTASSTENVTGTVRIYLRSNTSVYSTFGSQVLAFIDEYFDKNIGVGESLIKTELEEEIKDKFPVIRSVSLKQVDDVVTPTNSHTVLVSALQIGDITTL